MSYALITMIESNENCINSQRGITFSHKRLYEDEAVLCFKSWRENGGWLKDIPIYTYCPSRNVVSETTKEEMKKYNVTYIENFLPETDGFFSGFWNVPLCGKIFEETLSEDVLIHIDLDMKLIKPLPQELVDSVLNNDYVICGQYDDESSKSQRKIGNDWKNPLDTGFLISNRKTKFYKFFYEALSEITKTKGDARWKEKCSDWPLYFLEEYVIDKAYNEQNYPIRPIQKYQVGEGYAKISTYTDEELRNVYFWHEHILHGEDYDKIREKIEFFKRTRPV
ncbi:hypothetical protein ACJVC5_06550 [Peredibacter sp. HCB2-198]|uniref:hypothetical protein n=1 Tax=Peredibacter sp. HCB2-198 TaxID=3383025 RepID=UPI0038B604C1